MAKITKLNPLAATVGAAVVATAMSAPVQAADNPFMTSDLGSGYQVAGDHMEGKCGEGKCGESKEKSKEGNCGEGKSKEGNCGEGKSKEGNCGEGKDKEGSCGGSA